MSHVSDSIAGLNCDGISSDLPLSVRLFQRLLSYIPSFASMLYSHSNVSYPFYNFFYRTGSTDGRAGERLAVRY